jgi:hypothetical protein
MKKSRLVRPSAPTNELSSRQALFECALMVVACLHLNFGVGCHTIS